ncbi:hypothetical protein MMEU_0458 [Mycobacterium marinum str. Europe]|nr:hypothetical protein MMEU_0458 [Mycobacterium marinum str. Europe]
MFHPVVSPAPARANDAAVTAPEYLAATSRCASGVQVGGTGIRQIN